MHDGGRQALACRRFHVVAGGEWQGWKLSFTLMGRFLNNRGLCCRLEAASCNTIIYLHNKNKGM